MWKKAVKAAAFVLIFCLLFYAFSSVLATTGDYRNYQWVRGFYAEKRDTLDAVYIGSSTCYAYWNPLVGWDDFGIAVYPYATNAQHFVATEYLIREVRKTQPNAVIIVNTNTIDDSRMSVITQHNLLDYMPFSLNKLQLTKYLCDTAGLTPEERLELYFPMYRYHSRWNELRFADFNYRLDGMKGVSSYPAYRNMVTDVSGMYAHDEGAGELPEYVRTAAESLMDYCEKEHVRILFVTVPRVESEARLRQINTLNGMIEARGFDTLNMIERPELLGLDLTQDFYNEGHTNIHGSLKYTRYLAGYLMEYYGLTDKRGDSRYASWDKACAQYASTLNAYTLDIERYPSRRTDALARPEQVTVTEAGGAVRVAWSPVNGADGYLVWRRQGEKAWEPAGDTAETALTDTAGGVDWYYTVVPYQGSGEDRAYGRFDYHCVPPKSD